MTALKHYPLILYYISACNTNNHHFFFLSNLFNYEICFLSILHSLTIKSVNWLRNLPWIIIS